MRRLLSLVPTGIFAVALAMGVMFTGPPPTSAATIAATTSCSNGVDNTGGLGLICEVTVNNTITASGGSATVTVRECHGAAGNPQSSCTTTTSLLTAPVTAVNQCNDATNGGGGTLRCSVQLTNTFVGVNTTPTAATVNQCVGSGDGFTTGCVPFPATTSGATITECNGSANGGTLVGLTCTATGTQATGLSVAINQCNGSGNGGGALVICSANITNLVVAASPTPSATPVTATGSTSPTPSATPVTAIGSTPAAPASSPGLPNTSLALHHAGGPRGAAPLLLACLALAAALSLAAIFRRRTLSAAGDQ